MNMRTREDFAINPKLFKLIGFYQMVNPNGSKIFGYNAHSFIHAAMVTFTSSYTFVGLSGIFCGPDDAAVVDIYKDMQTLFYVACISVGNLKIITTIRNAGTIWKSFFVVREPSAVASAGELCEINDSRLANCGKRFAKIFPWYFFLFASTAFAWVMAPIILNHGDAPNSENFRKTNVINLRYPVTAKTYNEFHKTFFAMESVMVSYSAFGLVSFDLFMIAVLQMTSTQYGIVSSWYETLKCTSGKGNGECVFSFWYEIRISTRFKDINLPH